MRYYVDSLKIEEFINNCNGCINKMNDQIKAMQEIVNKTKWKGNAHDAALLKYNQIMSDVIEIPEKLSLYVKFMELVIKNYGEGTEKLKKEFKDIIEKLELERLKNEL